MVTTAVRNDRNKKRKPKQDGCVTSQQSEELTQEEETLIGQVVKAHDDTFNKKPDEDKFKVSANRVLVGAGVALEMNQGEHKLAHWHLCDFQPIQRQGKRALKVNQCTQK